MRLVEFRGKWHVRVKVNGKWKRLNTGEPATGEYREAADRTAREIVRTLSQAQAGETIMEIIDAYHSDMLKRIQSPQNPDSVKYARQALTWFWDTLYPSDVTRERCREYIKAERHNISDWTIRRYMGVMVAALRWAGHKVEAELPPTPDGRHRWITRDEFRSLLQHGENYFHVQTYLHLGICTWGRKEAILQLRFDTHVDFERNQIWLGFKQGGKRRSAAPMTQACRQHLMIAQSLSESGYCIEYAGKPVKNVKKSFKKVCTLAGVKDFTPHDLRTTGGTWAAMDGVDIFEIKERMGHSSIDVTMRHYARFHPEFMDKSTRAMEV